MRSVFVAGVGSTAFGRHPDIAIEALAVRAADAAIRESGLDRAEVGALYLGNFVAGPLLGQEVLAGLVADGLGLPQIPCTKVEGACASGGIAFRHAYLAVATGMCDVALAVGAEKMTHADTAAVTSALNCAMDFRSDGVSGLTFPGLFGLAWRLYEERYGATRDQISEVVRKNKGNGLRNPLAQMGADLSRAEIGEARLICDPLRLYDCCPASDGAAAVLLVAADRLADVVPQPVEVIASAQARGSARIAGHPDLCTFEATVAAAQGAYRQAGIDPAEVSFVELHDCFSIAEIIDSEDLGLIPRGQGAAYAAEGRTAVRGDRPINASGGLLAKGHPVGATGLGQIYESVLQLRGTHPNQVKGATIGLTHNLGGTGVACTVNILRATDA
ncbi:thiolase domain-containing protein [Xanthobacter dioxanivorans]|uniref:propanoyl-CoA C-acyltransferase n=1 Tax=Xanthobacter dioxanivorans TaxID=2528964 RepID=A0A974PT74_9HYPH|nr:beta-ketoacyl synthase N-terminal-like domain-containing protein [Xanthobacter dioxanivorans]QRG09328.1 thiolase domain-containing protein [Xanthobacter dioxanivorans]